MPKNKMKHLICSHDYVTVESMTVMKAAEKFVFEDGGKTDARNYVYASQYSSNKVLYDKACLKCGHCVTDLTDFRKRMKNMTDKEINALEAQVRRMQLDAAKRAAKHRERTFTAREIFRKHVKG